MTRTRRNATEEQRKSLAIVLTEMRFADPKECKEALQSLSTNSFGFAPKEPKLPEADFDGHLPNETQTANAAESAGSHPSSQVNLDGTDKDVRVEATPTSITVVSSGIESV